MSGERPKWTRAIQTFINDTVFDESYGYPEDGSDDELLNRIDDAVNEILCNAYGHYIEDDQCGIPAHRYCISCRQLASEIDRLAAPGPKEATP